MPTKNKLQIVYKNVDDLIPYARNAKIHDENNINLIAGSIKSFGFNNPVLLDGENGIIAGHGRVLASKKLGIKQIPTIELQGLSDAEKRAYIIADNRLTEKSEWDKEVLSLELQDLNELGIDLNSIGFDEKEFENIVEEGGANPEVIEDDYTDEVTEPKSQRGDIWILGEHRLMCGDSTKTDDVEKLMNGELADLLITDPPYNVNYEGKTKDRLKIENDKMSDSNFREFLRDAFTTADIVMKAGACFYIWYADSEGYNFRGACKDVNWQVRQCLIWNKNTLVMGRQDYQWKHEPCLYGWKDGASHLWASDRKQTTVIDFDKPLRNGEHPTMKPVGLFDYQIKNNTKGSDIVLDLFGGSGTTLIACEQNHRKARLMELDEHYVDVIIQRWQNLTNKDAVRIDGVKYNDL